MTSRTSLEVYNYFRPECVCGWVGELHMRRFLALRESGAHRASCARLNRPPAAPKRPTNPNAKPPNTLGRPLSARGRMEHLYPDEPPSNSCYRRASRLGPCRCDGCIDAHNARNREIAHAAGEKKKETPIIPRHYPGSTAMKHTTTRAEYYGEVKTVV